MPPLTEGLNYRSAYDSRPRPAYNIHIQHIRRHSRYALLYSEIDGIVGPTLVVWSFARGV